MSADRKNNQKDFFLQIRHLTCVTSVISRKELNRFSIEKEDT